MTLYAGPWSGELGHEIMSWQANVRRAARGHDEIVVGCVPASRPLYADFATGFIDVPFDHNTSGAQRFSRAHEALERSFATTAHRQGATWMRARMHGKRDTPGDFIRYGKRDPELAYDVVVHARDMVKGSKGGDRRRCAPWPFWRSLGHHLHRAGNRVACIGLKGLALLIPEAEDQRDRPLAHVMDLLASSVVIVGPSSGPIHLAALCDCPQVVWTDTKHGAAGYTNKDRLTKAWNPFDVPVRVIHVEHDADLAWIPDMEVVLRGVEEIAKQGSAT